MSSLDVQNISTRIPRFHSNTTIEEKVMNSFILPTEQASFVCNIFSFRQVISSQQLIIAEQPQKDLHTERDLKPPHRWRMHWFDAIKINYSIERLYRVHSRGVQTPDDLILLIRERDSNITNSILERHVMT